MGQRLPALPDDLLDFLWWVLFVTEVFMVFDVLL